MNEISVKVYLVPERLASDDERLAAAQDGE